MFIAALFITSKKWKQPKCLSADEWRNKMWGNHTVEYYLATKKEESTDTHNSLDKPENMRLSEEAKHKEHIA